MRLKCWAWSTHGSLLVHPASQCFSGTKRQATLPFKPLKKMKKRNPWSDSGSDSEFDFEAPPRRERLVRQAVGEWWHKCRRGVVCGGESWTDYLDSSQSLRSWSEIVFILLYITTKYFYHLSRFSQCFSKKSRNGWLEKLHSCLGKSNALLVSEHRMHLWFGVFSLAVSISACFYSDLCFFNNCS